MSDLICECDPESYDLGPEGQKRYFPDRYCPLHGEVALLKQENNLLREALEVYADHRNWGIRRDDMHRYPAAVWIGPRAAQTVPDAPGVARAALELAT